MSAILTEQDMKEAITLDDNTLRGSNIGFIVLLIILFLMAEFRHLALPKIQSTVNDAFISFSNLSKSFGSKFLNDWLGVRYNPIPYKKAVNGLSLAVKKNELFALLGIFNLFN
jgi:ABC-type glutathione transport system ATPase component